MQAVIVKEDVQTPLIDIVCRSHYIQGVLVVNAQIDQRCKLSNFCSANSTHELTWHVDHARYFLSQMHDSHGNALDFTGL